MITIQRPNYTLLLSYNPCEIFEYYKIHEMHGLNLTDCQNHNNTCESAYIAGWSNFVPKESGQYEYGDKRFVFINLSRCKDIVVATLTAMHELMHLSMYMFDYNPEKEEEMITWADNESLIVVDYINQCMETNYL